MKKKIEKMLIGRPALLTILLVFITTAIIYLLQSYYISALIKAPVHTIHIDGAEGAEINVTQGDVTEVNLNKALESLITENYSLLEPASIRQLQLAHIDTAELESVDKDGTSIFIEALTTVVQYRQQLDTDLLSILRPEPAELAEQDQLDIARLAYTTALLVFTLDEQEAQPYLEVAIELAPNNFWYLFYYGVNSQERNSNSVAYDVFIRAYESSESDADKRDVLLALVDLGDDQQEQGDLAAALQSYESGLAIAAAIYEQNPDNLEWRHQLFSAHIKIGDVRRGQGELAMALASYQAGLDTIALLDQQGLAKAIWRQNLHRAYDKIGDVKREQGDLVAALASYQAGLAIRFYPTQEDELYELEWLWQQQDLYTTNTKIGDMLQAQGDTDAALAAYQTGLAIVSELDELFPKVENWQRDIVNIYEHIAEIQKAQGQLDEALESYQNSLDMLAKLSRSDRQEFTWQHQMFTIYNKMGDIQNQLGELESARLSYMEAVRIIRALIRNNPENEQEWRGYLYTIYIKLIDWYRKGGYGLDVVRFSNYNLNNIKAIIELTTSNSQWQRILFAKQNELAEVHSLLDDTDAAVALYSASLKLVNGLGWEDADDFAWWRELSDSHKELGDLYQRKANYPLALEAYQQGLDIHLLLKERDQGSEGWQQSLIHLYDRIGDVNKEQGDLAAALTAYRSGLVIHVGLNEQNPGNTELLTELVDAYENIGNVHIRQEDFNSAEAAFQKALAVISLANEEDPNNARWQADLVYKHLKIGKIQRKRGALTAALISFQSTLASLLLLDEEYHLLFGRRPVVDLHEVIGDIQRELGDSAAALASYQKGLQKHQALARQKPSDPDLQFALAVFYGKVAEYMDEVAAQDGMQHWRAAAQVLQPLHDDQLLADSEQLELYERVQARLVVGD